MKLDRDGFSNIAAAAVPAGLALVAGRRRTAAALAVLPLAVGAFFRDPDRIPDLAPVTDEDIVLAPADAKVMSVGPADPASSPPGEWQQVVTFLSAFDVHVNRTPYGGTVTDVTYRPGRFLPAYKPHSGVDNERSEITVVRTVAGEERKVVFRQIVGIMARRVVTRVRPGDEVRTGERMGLMKFGSRMDVFLPPHVQVLVAPGDRTVAGETTLARWPRPASVAATVGDLDGTRDETA